MLAFAFVLGGCAREVVDRSSEDAGAEDHQTGISVLPPAAPADPLPVTLPSAPALPALTPCPSGWREEIVTSFEPAMVCMPWPPSGPDTCREDGGHFPGEAGCVLIGTRCDPADDWATNLPSSGVLYVRAGAHSGGVGTRSAPYSTIAEALSVARPQTTVALSKGLFDEDVTLGSSVTIWGACTAETILTSSAPSEVDGVIVGIGVNSTVRNLRISQSMRPGVSVAGERRSLRLEDVLIENTAIAAAVVQDDARLEARTLVVRDAEGVGLVAVAGGQLELSRVIVEGTLDASLLLWDSSEPTTTMTRAVLSDAVIRGTRDGFAADVQARARLELDRVVIEQVRETAVSVSGAGASAKLAGVVVQDLEGGEALDVHDGASIELERVLIERTGFAGARIVGGGTSATMSDVVVCDVRGRTAEAGYGMVIAEGAHVALHRVLVTNARTAGIALFRPETEVTVADVTVSNTKSAASIESGFGLYVSEGARIDGGRVNLVGNRESGLVVEGERTAGGAAIGPEGATSAALMDLTVRATRGTGDPKTDLLLGQGVTVIDAAVLELERSLIERNLAGGVVVSGGRLVAKDLTVLSTEGLPYPYGGPGVWVFGPSDVEITGLLAEDNVLAGVRIEGDPELEPRSPPRVHIEDLTVRDTRPTTEGYLGAGLASQYAYLSVHRALFERNHYAGVLVQGSTTDDVLDRPVVLEDIVVRDTEISNDSRQAFLLADFGYGLGADFRADVEVSRAVLEGNHSGGALALGSSLVLRDVVVRDSLTTGAGFFGRGLEIGASSTIVVERARFDRNLELGLGAFGRSEATLTDVSVEGTQKNACDDPGCVSPGAAIGIGVYEGSHVSVRRFIVSRNELCGLQLAEGGTIDLADGEVRNHRIGVNVQTDGFDLERLKPNVFYIDNDLNLDAAELPPPRPRIPGF